MKGPARIKVTKIVYICRGCEYFHPMVGQWFCKHPNNEMLRFVASSANTTTPIWCPCLGESNSDADNQ